MPYYLGIDQSLNATGLCVLAPDGTVALLQTVNPKGLRGVERLAFIKAAVIKALGHPLAYAAMEGYAYEAVGRVFELGEVGGIVKLQIFEHGSPLITVAPVQLKKFATGNPSADKPRMIDEAQRAGAAPGDDNQADAFFLASMARHYHLGNLPAKRHQLEVIHALRFPKVKKPVRKLRTLVRNAI